jgi:hypothetical protein
MDQELWRFIKILDALVWLVSLSGSCYPHYKGSGVIRKILEMSVSASKHQLGEG